MSDLNVFVRFSGLNKDIFVSTNSEHKYKEWTLIVVLVCSYLAEAFYVCMF